MSGDKKYFDAGEAFAWIAFGRAVPRVEWTKEFDDLRSTRTWGFNPAHALLNALQARARGEPWCPAKEPPFRLDDYEVAIDDLIQTTGSPAEALAAELEADVARWARAERLVEESQIALVEMVRDGKVQCWARRARGHWAPSPSAQHEQLAATLFLGPRTIDWDGWVRGDSKSPESDLPDFWRDAVYYDDVRFLAAEIRAHWHQAAGGRAGTVRDERAARRWLEDAIRAGTTPVARETICAEMMRNHGISKSAALRARSEAIEATKATLWKMPGRKSKGVNR